jgi:glycosyltransferase involved in cell wall biosynthesis
MRVLILEPHATGHHASYLRWLAEATRTRNWSVIIATTDDALSHPALTSIESEFSNVEVHRIRDSSPFLASLMRSSRLILREFGYWRTFKRTVSEIHARSPLDFIVLPYIDYCFYALSVLGAPFRRTPWCAISMRLAVTGTRRVGPPALPWKWRMARRLLASSSLRALFVINPSVSEVPPNWCSGRTLLKLRYLPDPAHCEIADSRLESRAHLDVSSEDVAILVFGSIDERKGIDSLLAALSSRDDLGNYRVILAGKQSPTMNAALASTDSLRLIGQRRLIVMDRFVGDAELGSLLAACDVVWVGYRNHIYMSGVLVLAGRAGLPVIGTVDGEIGRLITKHALGVVARIERPTEVAIAMHAMLDSSLREDMGRRARIAFENHTVEDFGVRVLAAFDDG